VFHFYSHDRRLHISIRAGMFAQRVAARQGTAAERVSLIGDDKAEPIARHAPARRGGLAAAVVALALGTCAVVAVVAAGGVSSQVRARFALGQTEASEIPEGIGIIGDNGMTTLTACDQKETFCDLRLFNDYMTRCCVLSFDVSTQQDCLCHPLDYGFEAYETDNVGVERPGGVAAALGETSRKLGMFRKKPASVAKLGKFQSPGCDVEGYCDGDPSEHAEDSMHSVCCSAFDNAEEANACLCDPMAYL
jgi:hypothetical protein